MRAIIFPTLCASRSAGSAGEETRISVCTLTADAWRTKLAGGPARAGPGSGGRRAGGARAIAGGATGGGLDTTTGVGLTALGLAAEPTPRRPRSGARFGVIPGAKLAISAADPLPGRAPRLVRSQ